MKIVKKMNTFLCMLIMVQVSNMHAVRILKGSESDTALIFVIKQNNVQQVKELIDLGADVNQYDKFGYFSPLQYAINTNNAVITDMLIKAGALISNNPDRSSSPLKSAVEADSDEALEVLIQAGANINERNSILFGESLMSVAAKNRAYKSAKILVNAGINCNIKGVGGRTPLFIAIEMNDLTMAQILLSGGAQVNVKDEIGITPLYEAASRGTIDILKLLLMVGGAKEINKCMDFSGSTALMAAVRSGCYDCVKSLIDAGADITIKDEEGKTALDLAQTQSADIIDLVTLQEDKEYSWEAALS